MSCFRRRNGDEAENSTLNANETTSTSADDAQEPDVDVDQNDPFCSPDDSQNTAPGTSKEDDHSSKLPVDIDRAPNSSTGPGLPAIMTPFRQDLRGLSVPNDLSEFTDNGPMQPKLGKFPPSRFGGQNRAFSASYYMKFPFVEYSVNRNAVFCFYCRFFCSSASEPTFTTEGFNDWKDVGDRLAKHAKSTAHADAWARYLAWMQSKQTGKPVAMQIDSHAKSVMKENRSAVSSLAKVAIVCARQDIALRGSQENSTDNGATCSSTNRGNFLELVDLLKSESSTVKARIDKLPRNANYCSKDSQNDLLDSAATVIKNRIVSEVQDSGMFTVIVDEARDISKTEQMSVCLRYVDGHEIKERFLSFVTLRNDLCAEALANAVANALLTCGLNLKLCVSQCYDGAAVMSGEFNGVQARLREMSTSPCIYVHCYAHRVNLVLVDTCVAVQSAGDLIGLLQAIHNFVCASTVRHDKFVEIQKQRNERVVELPLQSDTRWVCKLKAITAFKTRFKSVMLTLEFFSRNGKLMERAEVKGLLAQLKTPATVFFLHLLEEVLQLSNSLSVYCQQKQACMATACALVTATIGSLEGMRNDETFSKLYAAAGLYCSDYGIEVPHETDAATTTRIRRNVVLPVSLQDSVVLTTLGKRQVDPVEQDTSSTSCHPKPDKLSSNLRQQMFAVLDNMTGELKRRFSDTEPLLLCCDSVNPSSSTFLKIQTMQPLAEAYSYLGIDIDRLKSQVDVAKNMFQHLDPAPASPQAVLKALTDMKCAFPDLVTFTKLVLTIPVSSAGAERSFSTMRRVKTYLRSTMSDQRLTNLCLISIERSLSGDLLLNPAAVVDDFSSKGKRRIALR